MRLKLVENKEAYLHLHADCIPVKGALRTAICDLTRNELIFFPSEYMEVLEYITSDKIATILQGLECEEEKEYVLSFIEFLDENEVIAIVDDPFLFPPIEEGWDMPGIVQNAIIDINMQHHDFEKIVNELDELGCQFVQIRSFSNLLKLEEWHSLLMLMYHKSIESVELILKYDPSVPDEVYIQLIEEQPIISSLILHSSPLERTLVVDFGCDTESAYYIKKEIFLTTQIIDSQVHCGIITLKQLTAPSVTNYFENKLYNGCLNRKVSVDEFGEIKNCPSMAQSYGNISDTSLFAAINNTDFQDKWKITKDQIKTCKDCEFRYVCSDCRAFVEHPDDKYSKPLKCGYDPYTAQWEEWSTHPLKRDAINYYGLQHQVSLL